MVIYEGTLDRFGYELKVFCKTEKECEDKLLKEYIRVYKQENDDDPMVEIASDRYSDKTYYEQAKEDICIEEHTLGGDVEWC